MVWVSEQKLIKQFFSKMHQEGCGGTVLPKRRAEKPNYGNTHIRNKRISGHTKNVTSYFIHGLEQWSKVDESIFF